MAFTSYSDLKTTIASYLARSDLTAMIPTFIQLAELRLRREVRTRQMLVVATALTTGGDSTVGLPTDFLEMRDIHVNTNPITTLAYQAPNAFYNSYRVTESGKPTDYTVLATELQLSPVPSPFNPSVSKVTSVHSPQGEMFLQCKPCLKKLEVNFFLFLFYLI